MVGIYDEPFEGCRRAPNVQESVTTDTTRLTHALAFERHANDRVHALTTFVANALGTAGACVLVCDEGSSPTIVAAAGDRAPFTCESDLAEISLGEAFFICDPSSPRGIALANAGFAFYASVALRLDGSLRGALCAYGDERLAISKSQRYVLESLATEIGGLLAHRADRDGEASMRLRLLESVVRNANDSVLITEAEPVALPGPRIVYANATFTRTTGYTLADVVGKTPRILQGPASDARTIRRIGERLAAWQSVEEEILNYRKDGTPFWVELSITPVANDMGRFTHWVSVQRDVSDRHLVREIAERERATQIANAELTYRATHDDLTALFNRAAFFERLQAELDDVRRDPNARSAVLFLDLDGFKRINDTLGHRVGDLLLIEIAERLKTCVRPADMVARLGGDEFTYLLCGLGAKGDSIAVDVARRVSAALCEPVIVDRKPVYANASIGIAFVDATYRRPEDVVRDADAAMYEAKRDGGARYAIFAGVRAARTLAALPAQLPLGRSIAHDEIDLSFEPIVELANGRTRAFATHVRNAEAAEDGSDIGTWVLARACRHAAAWHAARPGAPTVGVYVGVDARHFGEDAFVDSIEGALAAAGLDPEALTIEIPERVFLDISDSRSAKLAALRSLGVRVAIGAYGASYASLGMLDRTRVDTLKTDDLFARLERGETTPEIANAFARLTSAIGIANAVSGVSSAARATLAARCGFTLGCGPHFGEPLGEGDVPAYLASEARAPS